MAAIYTWDVFSTVDGYGSYGPGGDWGGYWGKQGPELLAHRSALFNQPQRIIFGGNTFRDTVRFRPGVDRASSDDWNVKLMYLPATVLSATLPDTLGWPDATIERDDAVRVISELKASSPLPLRSPGSLALNHSLLAAGLIDRIQVTVFPVLSGKTGASPVFAGLDDYDLDLIHAITLDGRTQELTYRPTPRTHTPR